jgi:hypothetical protein
VNRNSFIVGAIVAAAALGLAVRFLRTPADSPAEVQTAAVPAAAQSPSPPPSPGTSPAPLERSAPARPPTATDPRLAALLGAPGDALVQYKTAPDGRVIQEVDLDPNSQGYLKPMREYQYAGDRLAVVTVYRYLGTQLQVTRATASYKADGSIDEYHETTDYRKP